MLLSAMMLNPGSGIPAQVILLAIAITGSAIGLLWIRRIAGDEDLGSSFWRSHPRGGQGSRLPPWPFDRPPALRSVATRAWIVVGLATVVAAIAGPMLLRRWDRPFEESAALAAVLWIVAIMAAILGTWWMLRILSSDR